MRFHNTQIVLIAGLLAILPFASALAQQESKLLEEARNYVKEEANYPKSPNDRPMEAHFDFAPEARALKAEGDTGPFLISRWGGIVIRGRVEGDHVKTNLNIVQCGKGKNPATEVTLIGVPPDDMCDSIKVVPRGRLQTLLTISGENYFGTHDGWVMVNFAQKIGEDSYSGFAPPTEGGDNNWSLTKTGAVFHNENGKHVFFAPGEIVDLAGTSFVAKPAMSEDEFHAIHNRAAAAADREAAAAMKDIDAEMEKLSKAMKKFDEPKPREHTPPPKWFYVLFFGLPVALIGGVIYWIVRRVRRKRGALPNPFVPREL